MKKPRPSHLQIKRQPSPVPAEWTAFRLWAFLGCSLLSMPAALWAAPAPSSTSTLGETVTNPLTAVDTTVSALLVDPAGTPTAGATAFVRTADGYIFLVKAVGQTIYNGDAPPVGYSIVSKDTVTMTVKLDVGGDALATLPYETLYTNPDVQGILFPPSDTAGTTTPPVKVTSPTGIVDVEYGRNGSNGRGGALFIRPRKGGNGEAGPAVTVTNSTNILTTNQIGIEAGSIGGKGGNGGDAYADIFKGADGGNGGSGGPVTVTNNAGVQISTTGDGKHGIFARSIGGQAGSGGDGFVAPGGGAGGHSSSGGSVMVVNDGQINTAGKGAHGIYGLSLSNNGGNGGDSFGFVGEAGSGGGGGSGGPVSISNTGIITTGSLTLDYSGSHAIFAQSIGGTGGSAGTTGQLFFGLNGGAGSGSDGGAVLVNNSGTLTTLSNESRGIFAQSIGGGGGTGSDNFSPFFSVGGTGSSGGNGGIVTIANTVSGLIVTNGTGSDGIFGQSVGGSGGDGGEAGSTFAIGGKGKIAGNGAAVSIQNFGIISTKNDSARGIVAQSIGGGGGDGGSAGFLVPVGGNGAGGGSSSTVSVLNAGSITTMGNDAKGILAQSIGGGGGNGGSAGSIAAFFGVAVGGQGDGGGNGGDVNITLQGKDAFTASLISTHGDRSTALHAQSVGGGGGNGGGAVQIQAASSEPPRLRSVETLARGARAAW
jgi:hypothetical protein